MNYVLLSILSAIFLCPFLHAEEEEGEAEMGKAKMLMHVPDNAIVFVLDHQMSLTGPKRKFVTPPMLVNRTYLLSGEVRASNGTSLVSAYFMLPVQSGEDWDLVFRWNTAGDRLILSNETTRKSSLSISHPEGADVREDFKLNRVYNSAWGKIFEAKSESGFIGAVKGKLVVRIGDEERAFDIDEDIGLGDSLSLVVKKDNVLGISLKGRRSDKPVDDLYPLSSTYDTLGPFDALAR